ncbi:hypothetical protein NC652_008155 [Populus alba x Populus x berolinensis]|nr:hypothetical protein NC652_008155 [Populus alba x Populus x berolinensis]
MESIAHVNGTRNISGSNWARLVPDFSKDEFVVSPTSPSSSLFFVKELWSQCTALFVRLMLPQGFPQSVTFDYLDYSLCKPSKALQAKLLQGAVFMLVLLLKETLLSKVRTSSGARYAAADIEQRLHLGSKLSDVVNNKNDVLALFNLYRDEGYILTEHGGRLCLRSKFFMGGIELTNSYSVLYLNYLQQSGSP